MQHTFSVKHQKVFMFGAQRFIKMAAGNGCCTGAIHYKFCFLYFFLLYFQCI